MNRVQQYVCTCMYNVHVCTMYIHVHACIYRQYIKYKFQMFISNCLDMCHVDVYTIHCVCVCVQ